MENGFFSSDSPYQYTVAEKSSPRLRALRVGLILLYVGWCVLFFLVGTVLRIVAPLLALIPITTWILVFLTWRWTQVEYEYVFFAGTLTVFRTLGGRSKKKLCEIPLRNVTRLSPVEEAVIEKGELFAASAPHAENLRRAEWTDGDGQSRVLFFEVNEKARKIIRYYNKNVDERA